MICSHYHTPLDIVSIKFKCCKRYYPCHLCHKEKADHPAETWPKAEFHTKAILCRHCHTELTIHEYLHCNAKCPGCHSPFNPACKTHWPLYFEA